MDPFTLFEPEFARRALLATLFVALAGGLLGTTVVLRELPFFAHAIGSGAYPMLVLGAIWGASAAIMGIAGAALFAGLLWLVTLGRGADPIVRDTRTGLSVAAALAVGALLTGAHSDEPGVAINPEAMLFGSVLTVDTGALLLTALTTAVAAWAVFAHGAGWLAAGFDRPVARSLGVDRHEFVMLQVVALCVAAALPVTGALMAGALLVVPAATARLFARRIGTMIFGSTLVALVAGVGGLYLSLAFDLPAGATIALAAGSLFVLAAIAASIPRGVFRAARKAAPATALLVVLALAGCGSGGSESDGRSSGDEGLPVVATTTQVADVVRQVGGDAVRVTTLLKAGADPHDFEPAPSDVAALQDARVIFKNGGDVDAWLQPAIDSADGARTPIDLSDGAMLLPPGTPGASESGHGDETFNAHWSLDPENLRSVALLVRDELIKADPKRRETYRARAADYRATVAVANGELRACAESTPESQRAVVAGHDDFVYLTERFGFETAALLRDSGKAEPSAADVERVTAAARKADAQSMLVSRGEAGRLDRSVASALDVPLLELYGDSLADRSAPDGTEAATSLGAIRFNLGKIVDAAGGESSACAVAR